MALAALGRRTEALRGETDAAVALIDGLLAGPSLLNVHELRVNPDFDPIRSDRRYQALA